MLAVTLLRRGLVPVARARRGVAALAGALAGVELAREQLGGIESRALRALDLEDPREAEFRVFSQFGEDGIIQYLVQRVAIEREVFVEFGVEDYSESNTRFLLVHDNWRGLILDGGTSHIEFLHRTGLDWRHHIDARSAFVHRDNVNPLIAAAGVEGDIGLLSIDIDGNDYWVLEALDVVSPRILVLEYNSTWGPEAAVTVPYEERFVRSRAHWSHLYWGASLAALAIVAERKGYALVAGNGAGNNAFFVRRDVLGALRPMPVARAYAPSRFRESRGPDGELTYVGDHRERLAIMRSLPLWDVEAEARTTVSQRFSL